MLNFIYYKQNMLKINLTNSRMKQTNNVIHTKICNNSS